MIVGVVFACIRDASRPLRLLIAIYFTLLFVSLFCTAYRTGGWPNCEARGACLPA